MHKKKKLRVLFVCNRGGHLSEMMALRPLFSQYESMLLTDNDKTAKKLELGIPVKYISEFRRESQNPFVFFYKFCQCLSIWFSFRPHVIITTGANLAVFMCIVGKVFRSKIIFIETGAKIYSKTLTGKIIGPICNKIIVQWPEMTKIYKHAEYWGQIL